MIERIEAAIADMRTARDAHLRWANYLANPASADRAAREAAIAGGEEFQRDWVERYDVVIAILEQVREGKSMEEFLLPPADLVPRETLSEVDRSRLVALLGGRQLSPTMSEFSDGDAIEIFRLIYGVSEARARRHLEELRTPAPDIPDDPEITL